MIRKMNDTDPMDEAQITREAERMAKTTGFDVDVCKAMLIIGERNTRRDDQGRLIADPEDIEDAAIDGDEV